MNNFPSSFSNIYKILSPRNLLWLLGIILFYLYLNLFRNAFIDDAFITLTYVKTLLTSGTWGFFPGYITNTATSPLNVLLLSFIGLFVGPTNHAQMILAFIGLVALAKALVAISAFLFDTEIYGYLGAVGFIFNPLMISTLGLESILFAALFVISIYCYLTKKWGWLAFVLGLLTLTRAEGVLFFVLFLIFIPSTWVKLRFMGIYILSILPWYLFSWIYLGSVIPDTFFIKVAQYSWGGWNFLNGLLFYFQRYPYETLFSFAFLPLALLLINQQVRKQAILMVILSLAVFHFVTYSVLQVWPFHWYYVTLVTAVILFGMIGVGTVSQHVVPRSWQDRVMRGVLVVFFVVPVLGMFQWLAQDQFVVKEMPIHTNWATQEKYKEIGLWLKDEGIDTSIDLKGEIGTISYYCECYLLDVFSHRDWEEDVVAQNAAASGLQPFLMRTNFLFYRENPPLPAKDYLLWLNYSTDDKIMRWQTSTRWSPEGSYTFAKYDD